MDGTIFILISDVMHCFEIRTANLDYFIGEDPLYGQKDPSKIQLPSPDSGIGAHLAKTWENAIRLHCMAEIMKGKVSFLQQAKGLIMLISLKTQILCIFTLKFHIPANFRL